MILSSVFLQEEQRMSTGAPPKSDAGQARFHMFTEEQQHLRKEIREFAAREIAPNVKPMG